MSIWLGVFLGIIQGLTEFLPVSSSGHLILFQYLFDITDDMLLFNIILHVATLLAVVIVFRKKIWQLIKKPFNKINLCLLISTAITCAFVLMFRDFIESTFTHRVLPVTFLITAILLFITSFVKLQEKPVGFFSATIVGFTQFLAVTPGISRSGATISTLLLTGTKREDAAEYSFLMSIPIIIASLVYEVLRVGSDASIDIAPTIFAFIAALLSGIIAIKFMLNIIKRVKLHWFSFYLVVLAIICFIIL